MAYTNQVALKEIRKTDGELQNGGHVVGSDMSKGTETAEISTITNGKLSNGTSAGDATGDPTKVEGKRSIEINHTYIFLHDFSKV